VSGFFLIILIGLGGHLSWKLYRGDVIRLTDAEEGNVIIFWRLGGMLFSAIFMILFIDATGLDSLFLDVNKYVRVAILIPAWMALWFVLDSFGERLIKRNKELLAIKRQSE
jgi:hypothetical protein